MNITPKYIKEYIEEVTQMDLGSKKRTREFVEMRCVAYKLTRVLTKMGLSRIGELYNRNHATVLHSINLFDDLYNQSDFSENKKLYLRWLQEFREVQRFGEIQQMIGIDKEMQSDEEVREKYEYLLHKQKNDFSNKIKELSGELERYKTNSMFQKISKLSEYDFQDLEVRVNAFLSMRRLKDAV